MSKEVDERVVSMEFDNKLFESRVKNTMSSIERLKQSLQFKGASKGFEEVNSAAKKVDMTNLGKGLEMCQAKFSALEVMGVTALANLTNSAVNAGKRIARALTIEPVSTGFSEYETKINSIQTIMSNTASKGTTMEDVTRVINELNTYADKTIYNFAEMTKNIGTFTAAGVGLEESAAAIQGIANLAAASGSTSQQASTAMYQLSQALAAGTVKLMDWNSVVNAGMGGEKFQEALKATAREHGIAVDSIIKKNGSFRESLSEGWISADILNETLNKFTVDGAKNYADSMVKAGKYTKEQADALVKEAQAMEDAATKVKTFTQLFDTMKESVQSGWSQTWELIIGDFEEAKDFLSKLSETFGKVIDGISNARNKILGEGLTSKWDQLNEKIETAGLSSEKFQDLVKSTAKDAGIPIDKLIKKYGSLAKVINAGKIPANIFTKALKKLVGAETETTKSTKDLGEVVKKVLNGEFGAGEERVKKLTEAGYDYAEVQNKVNEKLGSSVRHVSKLTDAQKKNAEQLVKLSDEQLKNKGYTKEQIEALRELEKAADDSGGSIQDLIKDIEKPSGRTLLLDSVQNMLKAISKILGAISKAWKETFDPITGDHVYGFVEGLNKLTESMIISDKTAENFQKVMEGLFSVFKLATGVISKSMIVGLKLASAVLSLFGTNLLEVAAFLADYVVKFRVWVEEHTIFIGTIDKLAKIIKAFADGIKRCVDAFMGLEIVSKTIEKFKNIFKDTFDNLSFGMDKINIEGAVAAIESVFKRIEKWIKGLEGSENIGQDIINGIVEGLKTGVSKLVSAVKNIATTIIDTVCEVLGIQSPSTVMITIGKFLISGLILGIVGQKTGLFSAVKNMGVGLYNLVKDNIGKVVDWLKNIDWPEIKMEHILGLGVITLFTVSVKKIFDLVQSFGSLAEGIGDMCSGAGTLMKSFADRINPEKNKFDQFANALLKMSAAIAVLAGSVYVLAQLDSDKLWNAVGAIAALTALLAGLTIAAAKLKVKDTDFGKLAVLLVGLSAALYIMASAIKKLEFLDGYNVGPILLGLAGMVGGIIALLFAFGKLTKGTLAKNIDKASVVIAKISITMLLLTLAIKAVSKLDPTALTRGMITLTLFGAFVAGLIAVTKLAGKNINGLGTTILNIAITMGLMVGVIKLVNGLEPGEMVKGITCMTLFAGLITGLIAATRLAGGNIKGIGSTMIGIATAMMLMTLTIKMVAGLDPEEIKKGLTCITIFGAIIVALVGAVSLIKNQVKGVAGTLLAISVVMGVMAALSIVMSLISVEGLIKGVTAVSILSGMIAVILHQMNGIEKAKGSLIAMTVAIGLLVGAVVGLSFMKPEDLIRSTAAISLLLGMFAMLMHSTSSFKSVKGRIKTIYSMLGVVTGLSAIVIALSYINPDSALKSTAALSILLLSFSTAMTILGTTGRISVTATKNLAPMLGVVTGLAAILGVMSYLNVEASIPSAIALSVLLNAMAAAMVILSFVKVSPASIGAMALMGLVVGELAVVLGVMSALNIEPSISTVVALSTLLLAMSAALVPLALVGAAGPAAFIGIGALATMIAGIGGLIIAIGALNEKFPQMEKFLNSGIPILEKIGYALGSFFGNIVGGLLAGSFAGFPQIGSLLSQFMTNATPFLDGVKSIDSKVLDGAKSLAQTILTLTAADILTGLTSWLTGGSSIADFGTQIGQLGSSMKTFADNLGTFDEAKVTAVTCASKALKILADAAKNIPNDGGLWGALCGENSLATFGSALPALATNINGFITNLGKFDDSKLTSVDCAGKAIKALAEAAKQIPNDGGLWGALCGENSLATFSGSLPTVATSLKSFVTNLGKFDETATTSVQTAGNIIVALSDAAKNIPNDGGFWGALCGENSLATFSGNLPTVATNLKNFVKNLGKIDATSTESVNTACRIINSLTSLANADLETAATYLKGFGNKLEGFAEKVSSFVTTMSSVDGGNVSAAISKMKSLISMAETVSATNIEGLKTFGSSLKKLAEDSVDGYVKAFNGEAPKSRVQKGARALATAAVNALKDKKDNFKSAGKSVITPFINGMKDKKDSVKKTAKSLAKSGASAIKTEEVYNAYKGAGKYCVEGFAAGITANKFKAKAEAKAMAKAALRAAEEALDENSPSKEFYRVGDFGGQGFINAFLDYQPKAFDAGKNMAEYATKGLNAAVAKMRNVIENDMDARPTITPVLDLSSVTAGASRINGMFNMRPSVGVMAKLGSINASMNNNQNGNGDVISAIRNLGRKLNDMPRGDTYVVDGVTYDDGSNVADAVQTLIRAAKVERRR